MVVVEVALVVGRRPARVVQLHHGPPGVGEVHGSGRQALGSEREVHLPHEVARVGPAHGVREVEQQPLGHQLAVRGAEQYS